MFITKFIKRSLINMERLSSIKFIKNELKNFSKEDQLLINQYDIFCKNDIITNKYMKNDKKYNLNQTLKKLKNLLPSYEK